MATLARESPETPLATLAAGFRVSWQTALLIVAINTGVAALLYTEETRPFWHPFITAQSFGLAIAYAVNAAAPWNAAHPFRRLLAAVAAGTAIGLALVVAVKGYVIGDPEYGLGNLHGHGSPGQFAGTAVAAFIMGLCASLFFMLKFREAWARAQMMKAEADRSTLSRQAVEAQLARMQAQVEPHFLFNTLASVQYLVETDPPAAGRLLGHLIDYLRAALPQLRASSSTVAKEVELARALLSILAMRIGDRLAFETHVPAELAAHPFPPNLLISLVENAIKHGIEPSADGGRVTISVARAGDRLAVSVADTGRGLDVAAAHGDTGVGLANVRERVAALYGAAGHFTLEPMTPHGARATIEIPYATD